MKIVIDARSVTRRMHGIARYTLNLILHLGKIDNRNSYHLLHRDEISPDIFELKGNFSPISVNIRLYSLKEQFLLPKLLKKISPDIYHSPTFSAPVIQPCKVIMTIHDMIHLSHGTRLSLFYRLYYLLFVKKPALKAKKIITVSMFSKKEISRYLRVPEKKIAVTYNGIGAAFFEKNDLPVENTRLERGYWLFVGNEKPHKNVNTLLKAYAIALKKIPYIPPLVLVGVSEKFLAREVHPSLRERVIPVVIDSDKSLVSVYRNASLFIAPSIVEGFGLPVIEAMASAVPVIASDIPVMREVLGDAALLVDPLSDAAIAGAMLRVYGNDTLMERLKKSGMKRATLFSWNSTAKQTLAIYEEVVKHIC